MDKYCKGCKHHSNAGRRNPKDKGLEKYNNWCCAKGAPVDIGHCKTKKLKELKS